MRNLRNQGNILKSVTEIRENSGFIKTAWIYKLCLDALGTLTGCSDYLRGCNTDRQGYD